MTAHPACQKSWSAQGAAHCSGCCETFASVGLFDLHRVGYGERGSCKPPDRMRIDHKPLRLVDTVWYGPEMPPTVKAKFKN